MELGLYLKKFFALHSIGQSATTWGWGRGTAGQRRTSLRGQAVSDTLVLG